jgi:hypothetical protein
MTPSTQAISPLRQRMLDDMRMRKLGPKTQAAYVLARCDTSPAFWDARPTQPLQRICDGSNCT